MAGLGCSGALCAAWPASNSPVRESYDLPLISIMFFLIVLSCRLGLSFTAMYFKPSYAFGQVHSGIICLPVSWIISTPKKNSGTT